MCDCDNVVPLSSAVQNLPFFTNSVPSPVLPPSSGFLYYDSDSLESMAFNPVPLNDIENSSTVIDDNQYEVAHWDNLNSYQSKYYSASSFLSEPLLAINNSSSQLSFINLNARSLPKHFDEISGFIHGLSYPFSVIGFSECWLNVDNANLFDLPGYTMYSLQRSSRRGGGVALCVSSLFTSCILREDLCFIDETGSCEYMFVELVHAN